MKNFSYKDLFIDICFDLWAGDAEISLDLFINEINRRIANLQSYLGDEAKKSLLAKGVNDLTGESWKEQDKHTKKEIEAHKRLLKFITTASNWTP